MVILPLPPRPPVGGTRRRTFSPNPLAQLLLELPRTDLRVLPWRLLLQPRTMSLVDLPTRVFQTMRISSKVR